MFAAQSRTTPSCQFGQPEDCMNSANAANTKQKSCSQLEVEQTPLANLAGTRKIARIEMQQIQSNMNTNTKQPHTNT